jgi:GAF domain-containing protein
LRVTSSLPRFDDWLNRLLEDCARNAGVDIDTYVARAVASQMVVDQRQEESPSVEELLAHLSDSVVFAETGMPSVAASIADPDRLRALHATGLLDSPPEEVYDRITRAAAAALDAPYAAVSLIDVDRQFLKSTVGMGGLSPEERQTPLERSVCQYAVANGTPLILEDARIDPVFKNHPAVLDGTVVAYLGMPLADHEGNAVGTLCVFDDKPRLWSTGHIKILTDLAALAAERIFDSGFRPND